MHVAVAIDIDRGENIDPGLAVKLEDPFVIGVGDELDPFPDRRLLKPEEEAFIVGPPTDGQGKLRGHRPRSRCRSPCGARAARRRGRGRV